MLTCFIYKIFCKYATRRIITVRKYFSRISKKESIKYEKVQVVYGVCMAIFSRMQQLHSDFRNYIETEKGDQQAKDILDYVSVALISFQDILDLKFGEKFNENSFNFGLNAVKSSINRVISNWEFSIKGEEDLKALALEEINKAIAAFSEGEKAKPGFASDRQMLCVISNEIKKTIGKEINKEEAFLILTFLSVEEKDIGSNAEDKHFLKSAARSAALGLTHS
jgi:hypothetical protein